MNRQVIQYLDYEIVNTGNSDGWVITKPTGNLWECNLGNFLHLRDAKKYATLHFMIARPSVFHHSLIYRLTRGIGSGAYLEKSLFERVLKTEGIPMPPELTMCNYPPNLNSLLTFEGEAI